MRRLYLDLFFLIMIFFNQIFLNTAAAKEGTVKLKIKKTLEIDPEILNKEEPPFIVTARKSLKKKLILLLSWKPKMEILSFDDKGSFKKRFLTRGEGPGELLEVGSFQILNDIVIVSGRKINKVITFDLNGQLKEEIKLKYFFDYKYFLDENRFIGSLLEFDKKTKPKYHFVLMNKRNNEKMTYILKNKEGRDVCVTMVKYSQQYHPWVTPVYNFAYLRGRQKIICGVSDRDKLYLKDLTGKTIKAKKLDFEAIDISDQDRKRIIESAKSLKSDPELYKGFIKKIPKKHLIIRGIRSMPRDYFAVLLGIGLEKYIFRIFDSDLNHVCDIQFPEEFAERVGDLRRISFFEKGFYLIDNSDEGNRYVEYEIENLKHIFR